MAVLNREEFFSRLNERLANDTSDTGIAFLEDMTDTYNDLERRASGDGVDWEKKYHEMDESWKKKYTHRFFTGSASDTVMVDEKEGGEGYVAEDIKVEDLFTKKEEK